MSRQNSQQEPHRRVTLPHIREVLPDIPFGPADMPPHGGAPRPLSPAARGSPGYPQHINPAYQHAPQHPQHRQQMQEPRRSSTPGQYGAPPMPAYPAAHPAPAAAHAHAHAHVHMHQAPAPGQHIQYQVLAMGPAGGLNALQTETDRPIGIYRQDRRRHEVHATPGSSAAGAAAGGEVGAGGRRYVCPDCGQAFVRPSELQTHQHRHGGRKQFCCELCVPTRDFATPSNLKRHKRSAHPGAPGTERRASRSPSESSDTAN